MVSVGDQIADTNIFSIFKRGDLERVREVQNHMKAGLPPNTNEVEKYAYLSNNMQAQNKLAELLSRVAEVANMRRFRQEKRRVQLLDGNDVDLSRCKNREDRESYMIAYDDEYCDNAETLAQLDVIHEYLKGKLWALRNSFNKI